MGTQYSFINKMKKKFLLTPLSASHALTVLTLERTDRAFPRMRRAIEDEYGLRHGTIGGV